MKNVYILVIVLVLLVAGGWFFMQGGEKVEAPVTTDTAKNLESEPSNDVGLVDANVSLKTTTETTTTTAVKEFTVSGTNYAFDPSTIKVKKGDKVKITFKNTQGFHDWVIDEYGVATKQTNAPTTEVLEFTADKVGSFEYYCSVGSHRAMGMKGTLVVE